MSEMSVKDMISAVRRDDIKTVTQTLEEFGFKRKKPSSFFTSEDRLMVKVILGTASACAREYLLSEQMALEIIDWLAPMVNTFEVLNHFGTALQLALEGADESCAPSLDAIPAEILKALKENKFSDEIAEAIDSMDDGAFEDLITYLTEGKIDTLSYKFSVPVIRRIYHHCDDVFPDDLLFAYMASGLRPCAEEILGEKIMASEIMGLAAIAIPNAIAEILLSKPDPDGSGHREAVCDWCKGDCDGKKCDVADAGEPSKT